MTNSPTNTAISAATFLSGIGVDAHIAYTDGGYANIQNVVADLRYLGIANVRDGISDGTDYNGVSNGSAPLSSYIALAKAGIKFTIVVDVSSTAQLQFELNLVKELLAAVPGSVVALEGPNEINNGTFTYNGVSGIVGALAMQSALYSAAHGQAVFAGVSVDYFTGYDAGPIPVGPDPATTPGLADADNEHVYPQNGGAPAPWVARSQTLPNLANVNAMPAVYTEAGYTSDQVDVLVQAKYELDLLLDSVNQDISKTYLDELMDAYAPGSAQGDAGFGLFASNTAPKLVANALHNLTSILKDTGANAAGFVPTALAYTISGLPSTGNSQVIELSNGTTYIAVWAEPPLVDLANKTDIPAPSQTVTVNLPQTCSAIEVIDPLLGTSPIAAYANTSTVTFTLTDHPILIELAKSGTVAPVVAAPTDTLALNVAEQANAGNAQFVVEVDGKVVGDVQTVTASKAAGQSQNITLTGNFGSGPHIVSVDYLNYLAGSSFATDRLLYVNSITFDGKTYAENTTQATWEVANFKVAAPAVVVPVPGVAITISGSEAVNTRVGTGTNTTYVMNTADKSDTIANGTAASVAPSGQLDIAAADHDRLWFQKSGINLLVDILGTGQQAIVENWYSGSGNQQLQQIVGKDRYKIDSGVQALVAAMATFATSNPTFDPTSTTHTALTGPYFATVATAVAGAWHQ